MKTSQSTYDTTWGTPIGRDCIDLHTTMARWLGERLVFLADHTKGYPVRYTFDDWTHKLRVHGESLLNYANQDSDDDRASYHAAQNALMFVTRNLGHLWD